MIVEINIKQFIKVHIPTMKKDDINVTFFLILFISTKGKINNIKKEPNKQSSE
jgi:asparagine N-glycosylation enzyme membrane subunit Stt3